MNTIEQLKSMIKTLDEEYMCLKYHCKHFKNYQYKLDILYDAKQALTKVLHEVEDK